MEQQQQKRKERKFPSLELKEPVATIGGQPTLVVHSPKTPTLSRKLKAVSLDSDPQQEKPAGEKGRVEDVGARVCSMPNTPKRQLRQRQADFEDGPQVKTATLAPGLGSNLKRFASNSSISGSQTLKTLPEIMTLQDFSDNRTEKEPVHRVKAKGLLERRGSNASLTIDLSCANAVTQPPPQLNAAKSVSNLNLTAFGAAPKCDCAPAAKPAREVDRRKSQTHLESCGNCTIYESVPSKTNCNRVRVATPNRRCGCVCNLKCGRKSLSNENLYVPPCNSCHNSTTNARHCKGHRRACYPRQADLEASQTLSDDFKMHLQNVQYLQTASNVMTVSELKASCERVPKLHQEFWEVPLNLQEKCLISGSQTRNRYRGVLPNEYSRVQLGEDQPYIHANYIKGPDYTETAYIATQGPMAHTCEDFWEMVWLNQCNCVVMLTQLVEKGRNKCELYFPLGRRPNTTGKTYYVVRTTRVPDRFTFDNGHRGANTKRLEEELIKHEEIEEIVYGKYTIRHVSRDTLGECMIRKLSLERKDSAGNIESRGIVHYWYPNWQDHKMADPKQVLDITLHVLEYMEGHGKLDKVSTGPRKHVKVRAAHSETRCSENGATRPSVEQLRKDRKGGARRADDEVPTKRPLVVHCSAGIGRTGCFLAILNGIQQLRSAADVDVLAILCSLRLHRGGMVQTAEQYELIHQVLSLYADQM